MTITLISCLAAALLLWSMLTDYLYAVIPNGVTASVALLFVAFAIASGMPWSGWGSALCAGGLLLGAGFGLFALGVIGGGDAKLLAATALWAGWQGLPDLLMIMGLVGGLVTLPIILFHDRFSHGRLLARRALGARVAQLGVGRPVDIAAAQPTDRMIPYGIAISAAALPAVLLPMGV
jgi:prepilin peptidase CpaA